MEAHEEKFSSHIRKIKSNGEMIDIHAKAIDELKQVTDTILK